MKKNYIYLGVLVLTVSATCFFLPKSLMVYHSRLSIFIPTVLSIFLFGGFVSNTPEIKRHFVKINDQGREDDKNLSTLIAVGLFFFFFIYLSNYQKAEILEFENNGILTQANILNGQQQRKIGRRGSSTDSKLQISFTDNLGKVREENVEVDDADFEKYALGQTIQIKYLPNDPSLMKVQK